MFYKITANIFVNTNGERDLSTLGHTFEMGAVSQLSNYPEGDIFQVDVDNVKQLDAEEIEEYGFEDEYEGQN